MADTSQSLNKASMYRAKKFEIGRRIFDAAKPRSMFRPGRWSQRLFLNRPEGNEHQKSFSRKNRTDDGGGNAIAATRHHDNWMMKTSELTVPIIGVSLLVDFRINLSHGDDSRRQQWCECPFGVIFWSWYDVDPFVFDKIVEGPPKPWRSCVVRNCPGLRIPHIRVKKILV